MFIEEFEDFPVFAVRDEPSGFYKPVEVPKLSDEERADLDRVTAEYTAWQQRLKALYHQHW